MRERVALFGDEVGIPQALSALPREKIACFVASGIRPNGHEKLRALAQEFDIPLLIQPKRKESEYLSFVSDLSQLNPDLILCNSYSLMIREEIRALVDGEAINVHGALLPRNRGCNPIQWAIIRGESEFGVTMHVMDDSFDCGDIVAQRQFPIYDEDTWVDVRDRLWKETEQLLVELVPILLGGHYPRIPQNEGESSHNSRLTPDSPRIDFTEMNDQQIYNLVRAQVAPLSGAFFESGGKRIHLPRKLSIDEVARLRSRHAAHSYTPA